MICCTGEQCASKLLNSSFAFNKKVHPLPSETTVMCEKLILENMKNFLEKTLSFVTVRIFEHSYANIFIAVLHSDMAV